MANPINYDDLSYIRKYRRAWGYTQDELIEELEKQLGITVSRRTLQYWERGLKTPKQMKIKQKLYQFMHSEKSDENAINERFGRLESMQALSYNDQLMIQSLFDTLLDTILKGIATARWIIDHPGYQIHVPTHKNKADQADKTTAIDYFVQERMIQSLRSSVRDPLHPFHSGIIVISEETPKFFIPGDSTPESDCKYILLIDPIDYTAGAVRRGEGTVLLSLYHKDHGILAVVLAELLSDRIYYRLRGENSRFIPFVFNKMPLLARNEEELKASVYGTGYNLRPTNLQKSLTGASINIYRGSVERENIFIKKGASLLDQHLIKSIFSIGGSLPMARVSESLIDCCLDWKGFYYHDFIPGAFLAEGSGVVIRDFNYQDYTFGADCISESYLNNGHTQNDEHRSQFICCSTPELYADILRHID